MLSSIPIVYNLYFFTFNIFIIYFIIILYFVLFYLERKTTEPSRSLSAIAEFLVSLV